MKSALDKLTGEEKSLLAHFVGSETYTVLRKLVDIERLELAKDHVNQDEIKHIKYLSGKSDGLKGLIETLIQNKKNVNKKSKVDKS